MSEEISIQWISGDTPESALYRIANSKGESTVIDANRMAKLTRVAMEKCRKTEMGNEMLTFFPSPRNREIYQGRRLSLM